MKKCSRSVHHSLTELNITPLLDLAFVLLVIFIITTIPPVTDVDLKLPTASKRLKDPPRDANKKEVASADEMLSTLIGLRTVNQDLNVIVRGDGKTKYRQIRAVLDVCQQANVPKVNLATETLGQK